MQDSAGNSFLKFLFGFLIFISVSFGVTYTVNQLAMAKDYSQAAAAARANTLNLEK